MAQFDQAIQKAEAEMKEAQSKIDLLTGQIEAAQSKLEAGEDISIDIENATLDDVHSHTEAMNANIKAFVDAIVKAKIRNGGISFDKFFQLHQLVTDAHHAAAEDARDLHHCLRVRLHELNGVLNDVACHVRIRDQSS